MTEGWSRIRRVGKPALRADGSEHVRGEIQLSAQPPVEWVNAFSSGKSPDHNPGRDQLPKAVGWIVRFSCAEQAVAAWIATIDSQISRANDHHEQSVLPGVLKQMAADEAEAAERQHRAERLARLAEELRAPEEELEPER